MIHNDIAFVALVAALTACSSRTVASNGGGGGLGAHVAANGAGTASAEPSEQSGNGGTNPTETGGASDSASVGEWSGHDAGRASGGSGGVDAHRGSVVNTGGFLGLGGYGACAVPVSDGSCLPTFAEMSQVGCASFSFRMGACGSYSVWYCPDAVQTTCLYDQSGALQRYRYCDGTTHLCSCLGGTVLDVTDATCDPKTLPGAPLPEATGIGPDGTCYEPASTGLCKDRFEDNTQGCSPSVLKAGDCGSELLWTCGVWDSNPTGSGDVECHYTKGGDLRKWVYRRTNWAEPCGTRGGVRAPDPPGTCTL